MDEINLIGVGGLGKVYRMIFINGDFVVVKRFWGVKKNDRNNDYGFMIEVIYIFFLELFNMFDMIFCICSGFIYLFLEWMRN